MTYRERREARIERLTEWAGKREARGSQALDRAAELGEQIPFGQPILIGHHSEGRHRRDLARIESATRQGVENLQVARRMTTKAATIQSQLASSIYRDDPDAVEQLTARIGELEAARDRIKAYNASCRRGAPDSSLLTERELSGLAVTARVAPYSLGKGGGFPAYHLANLNGNISRNRKRLATMAVTS